MQNAKLNNFNPEARVAIKEFEDWETENPTSCRKEIYIARRLFTLHAMYISLRQEVGFSVIKSLIFFATFISSNNVYI